ncbi:MAG: tyrosine-type recombinase/integrase [Deltaproteobacteria bacterium]|nr:tyrosine-type recombinase/integrase [Deltaproteobacteria bacterium]
MRRQPWDISREMFLNEAEVETLLVHLGRVGLADRLIIEALLFSGLRCSELCRLRAADTVLGHKQSAFIVRCRGGEDRTVHVPKHVSRLVREYWKKRQAEIDSVLSQNAPLLANERGKPFERTGLYRRVVAILTAAGLGDRASVQLLRHTYGYLAYLKTGGNLLFVQRQLGHSHPMVTSIYAQFVVESYAKLAEKVAAGKPARRAGKPHRILQGGSR